MLLYIIYNMSDVCKYGVRLTYLEWVSVRYGIDQWIKIERWQVWILRLDVNHIWSMIPENWVQQYSNHTHSSLSNSHARACTHTHTHTHICRLVPVMNDTVIKKNSVNTLHPPQPWELHSWKLLSQVTMVGE